MYLVSQNFPGSIIRIAHVFPALPSIIAVIIICLLQTLYVWDNSMIADCNKYKFFKGEEKCGSVTLCLLHLCIR